MNHIKPMNLYIATSNPGKLRDFTAVASPTITLTSLPLIQQIPAPPEDEPTFEGNARLKAIYYSRRAPGEIVIADDSGLEVERDDEERGVRLQRVNGRVKRSADRVDAELSAAFDDVLAR